MKYVNRKANWIGHILRRNCLLQRVIEGKIKGGIEVTGRQGRRRRKLLDDLNPLNAELNPICQLLVLLGDLKFVGPCIVSIFKYISNKIQRYAVYLYLETALHVSGGTSTHHQGLIQLYLQHLVFVTSLLLSAAVVEKLEPV